MHRLFYTSNVPERQKLDTSFVYGHNYLKMKNSV